MQGVQVLPQQPVQFGGFGVPQPVQQGPFGGFGVGIQAPLSHYDESNGVLKIKNKFNFDKYQIDSSIEKLIIDGDEIKNIHKIPPHIKDVVIKNYSKPINFLNYGVKSLELLNWSSHNLRHNNVYAYPHKLDNLSDSLETLIIHPSLEFELENLPNSLKYLKLLKYDKNVDNLPSGLKYLILNDYFNQPVDNLPSSLVYLETGMKFNQPVDNLPSNLKYLSLGYEFKKSINNLPVELESLILRCSKLSIDFANLPKLKNLKVKYDGWGGISNELEVKENKFPETLQTLAISGENIYLNKLPSNLNKIELSNFKLLGIPANKKIKSLKTLEFIQPLCNFPNSLEEIIFDNPDIKSYDNAEVEFEYEEMEVIEETNKDFVRDYTKKLIKRYYEEYEENRKNILVDFTDLPSNVKKLTITNISCDCIFPKSLTHLTLIDCNVQNINISNLPDNLQDLKIEFTEKYDNYIYFTKLPQNLKNLICYGIKIENKDIIKLDNYNINIVEKEKEED